MMNFARAHTLCAERIMGAFSMVCKQQRLWISQLNSFLFQIKPRCTTCTWHGHITLGSLSPPSRQSTIADVNYVYHVEQCDGDSKDCFDMQFIKNLHLWTVLCTLAKTEIEHLSQDITCCLV